MRKIHSALLIPLAAAALWASPALGKSGSGSDGTPDDKIEDEIQEDIEKEIEKRLEDRIDSKIEERAEEKARDKARERTEEKIREKSERKTREDEKRLRDERKFEREIEKRTRSDNGEESRSRERVKEREKTETRTESGSRGRGKTPKGAVSSTPYVGSYSGVMDKAAIESARDSAKTTFNLSKAAADAGRDAARDAARAEKDAAMALPGADKDAIDAAYKTAVKTADAERDLSIEEAKETYEETLEELDEIEDGYDFERSDDVIASAERVFAASRDANGDEIARGEWLLLTTPEDVDAIVKRGFAVKSIEVMKGLGAVLARLEAPESFSLPDTSRAVRAETPGARVDYNHLYFPESAPAPEAGDAPSILMPLGDAARGAGVRIGVIDTEIDKTHAAFRSARLISRSFVPYDHARPADHGTAVASIIAGDDGAFAGLAPKAEIFAASVFFESAGGKASATTESLVRALDWMSEAGAPIVSMSLAGPPNAILEEAIKRAARRGVTVVAAAGNEGPMARPMYPAAYEDAVAVTAVTREKKAYRLANRGDYVDLAAPGVAVLHAKDGGGYSSSSGTSMAAPFVAVALGELRRGEASAEEALRRVFDNAEDLGEPGRDPVYGAGLVRPVTN